MASPKFFRPAVIAAGIASAMILVLVGVLTYFSTPWPKNSAPWLPSLIEPQADTTPSRDTSDPTVASLTPAGTDLLLGMGAESHIVAICDLDQDIGAPEEMPHIGDYDHVDWEKLAAVHPALLITQFGDRMPSGFEDRCKALNIRVVDIKMEVLADIYSQAGKLAQLLGETDNEQRAVRDLQHRLNVVATQSGNYPPQRVAVVMSQGGSVALIGPGSFHDQLLTVAGGINVAAKFKKPYVTIDREQLAALAPDVVFDLQPSPPGSIQTLRQAATFWASLPDLPAVRNHRVYTITAAYALQPGWHVADLAETFAADLHGNSR